jgi:carbonic anhydrase
LNYDQSLTFNFSNNKHTIQSNEIGNATSNLPQIQGAFLNDGFYLKQFHFHWDATDEKGSEHHINLRSFPLELHFVHESKTGELAVLGIIFEISETDNPDLNVLVNAIGYVNLYNSSVVTLNIYKMFNLEMLNSNGYYRYIGSLTTPPCTEGIIWTVFRKYISISKSQLDKFHVNEIAVNARVVQNLEGRQVYISYVGSSWLEIFLHRIKNFFASIVHAIL